MKSIGIDTSKYQDEPLDWTRIKDAGYDFVFVRYGHGDGSDNSGKDEWFDRHFNAAKQAGLMVGAYWYMWSMNIPAQVALFANYDPTWGDLPMAVDIEQTSIHENSLKLFLTELKRVTGRRPIIYTRKNILDNLTGVTANKDWLKEYEIWVAQYPSVVGEHPSDLPKGYSNYQFWQFTSEGRIPGYSGDVDINQFNGTVEDLCCRYGLPKPADAPLRWPVASSVVTQKFGENPAHYGPLLGAPSMGHEGIDIRALPNGLIWACADGTVAEKYYDESYGNLIVLDHMNGFRTLYAHLSRPSHLSVGDRIKAGDKIGDAGTTGSSTGVHLHLTLYYEDTRWGSVYPKKTNGYIVNPTSYLQPLVSVGTLMRNKSGLILNIRAEPSVTSADIGDVPVDAVVMAYPPATNDYLKIVYNSVTGYALNKHFEPTLQAVLLRSTAQPFVNIRSEPTTNSTDIGNLNFNDTIMGYPIAGDPFWRVIHNGADAWISSQWLVVV